MYRYIGFAWDPGDERQNLNAHSLATTHLTRSSSPWRLVLDLPGLRVWDRDHRAQVMDSYPLPHGNGVILGSLFSRANETTGLASDALSEGDLASVANGGISTLLARYWGRYVAVLRHATGRVQILRDPGASLPCLYTIHQGLQIFFSDTEDACRLPLRFTLNWDFLAAYLLCHAVANGETGLTEVSEVTGGECLEINRGVVRRQIAWDPYTVALTDPVRDVADALSHAQRTIDHCVASSLRGHERILHRLSGGLDSSLVLACIGAAGRAADTTALNYFGEGSQEDERFYARLTSQHVGTSLIEEPNRAELNLARLNEVERSFRPHHYLFYLEHVSLARRLAYSCGASAVTDGAGGDALFYQFGGSHAISDRLRSFSLGLGLLRTIFEAAYIEQESIWHVLGQALRIRRGNRSSGGVVQTSSELVNRPLCEHLIKTDRFACPWDRHDRVLPGKRTHILSTIAPVPFYEPFSEKNDPDPLHPLMSQPILELFFRIPTYLLIAGGRNRGLVRKAFAQRLPPEIVQRRGKGSASRTLRRTFDANRELIRQMLLDGELARRQLLDRAAVEACLRSSLKDSAFSGALIQILPAQAWVSRWLSHLAPMRTII
jgi:asparagine synthase (glutamine-hydrolysing)